MPGRVVLHDDIDGDPLDPKPVRESWLDTDPPYTETEVHPTVTIRVRTRTGWTDDGDPEFSWTVAVTDTAIVWEERTERDDVAGTTRTVRRCTVAYDNEVEIDETANVWCDPGGRYRVLSSQQVSNEYVELIMQSMEDADG